MAGPPLKKQKREQYRRAQEKRALGENGLPTAESKLEMPKKKFYRQRAHANPFSDHNLTYPTRPEEMDWTSHFPAFARSDSDQSSQLVQNKSVEIVDIGCGFGGLLTALSPLFPNTLMIGMELRMQVLDYVQSRIAALRSQNPPSSIPGIAGSYENVSALRTNTMKFMPNYFRKDELSKIFLCFPDPHFKQRKHKARIVSAQLNAEYAFVLRPGGKVYTITDVEELHQWMVKHFEGIEAGPVAELWERVSEEELNTDPCVKVMTEETEEGKKVTRNGGKKFVAVFRRRENPPWPE